MDLDSGEDSKIVRIASGLAVITICLAIGFRSALNRSLSKLGPSLKWGFAVVEQADDILDDLDRLRISQRAFLFTGEDRFSQSVIESATGLIEHVDALKDFPAQSPALRHQIMRLSHSVDWVLDTVGQSNDLQQSLGTAVALALLDEDGDHSIQDARLDAVELKKLVTSRVVDRVSIERKLRSVLDVLF
ncbi:MAG: CHASE3 domain-containing protein [Candidatus Binataceae bacterium]